LHEINYRLFELNSGGVGWGRGVAQPSPQFQPALLHFRGNLYCSIPKVCH